jgi:hypothetical protein
MRDVGFFPIRKGYIVLPYLTATPSNFKDERTNYIAGCFRKKKVSVLFDNGGFTNLCPIDINTLRSIDFPEKFGRVGSTVLCWIEPISGKPVVFANLGSESDIIDCKELTRKLYSSSKKANSSVGVDGEKGQVFINADSVEDDGGNVYITVSNKSRTGKLKINVIGTSEIYSDSDCTITSGGTITALAKDVDNKIDSTISIDPTGVINANINDDTNKLKSSINIDSGNIIQKVEDSSTNSTITQTKSNIKNQISNSLLQQTANGFKLENGSSGLKKTLGDILTAIQALTVPTGTGPSGPPINIADFIKAQTDLTNYLE